ncbi:MAG: hypothetical protein HC862_04970 [Scytonema sp. RU_4_4]|nr:hypothetical protein [Scytonema sp. RU_4_4]NJR73869.1 hypothetical protein [Scytonema sp. CRU_2_7]
MCSIQFLNDAIVKGMALEQQEHSQTVHLPRKNSATPEPGVERQRLSSSNSAF